MNNTKDRVTIYQVAKAAGVSLATVSRVINNNGSVTEATRKKVEATINALGYKPSSVAQALATNRSTNVGLVIPSANYVYIANLLNGITEVAKEKGFSLTLFATSHSREEALLMIEKVISSHVDGAIIFDDQLDEGDIAKIASYNVPSIVIDMKASGEKIGNIVFNYEEAIRSEVINFYERGKTHPMYFLHVHNAGRLLAHAERTFVKTNEELGKTFGIINCDDSYARTYSDFLSYFKENKEGTFICYRDSIAAAVENAATDSGLKVPEDVEVISIVGTKYANILRPSLTALHIDMSEVGKRAMYMLIDLLHGELIERSYKFTPVLVERSSTTHD